jgi:hypothetical protein
MRSNTMPWNDNEDKGERDGFSGRSPNPPKGFGPSMNYKAGYEQGQQARDEMWNDIGNMWKGTDTANISAPDYNGPVGPTSPLTSQEKREGTVGCMLALFTYLMPLVIVAYAYEQTYRHFTSANRDLYNISLIGWAVGGLFLSLSLLSFLERVRFSLRIFLSVIITAAISMLFYSVLR